MSLDGKFKVFLKFQTNKRLKFDIVRISSQQTLSSHIQKVIQDYRIDTVLDVGANVGQFGCLIRKWGFKGDIQFV
jgi:hypothetical protein